MAAPSPRARGFREAAPTSTSHSRMRRTSFRSSRARSASPPSYAFDYEFARAQHGLGCRAARRVVVPEAIPQDRLDGLGARARKVRRYPGLKEEYYLARLRARRLGPRRASGSTASASSSSSAPRPRCRSTTGTETRCSPTCSSGSDATTPCTPSSCRGRRSSGTRSARATSRRSSCPSTPIDAQSLVALADLVVSAGGTMNREAVALGVPVYTTFAGRLGAVDSSLVNDGRLRILASVDDLALERRRAHGPRRDREIRGSSSTSCSRRSSASTTSRPG